MPGFFEKNELCTKFQPSIISIQAHCILNKLISQYWGKADPWYAGQPKWHPLIYHLLDVAVVAAAWWDACPALRGRFHATFPNEPEDRLRAWMLFFIALHDLGKADVRFQLKAPDALAAAWRKIEKGEDYEISPQEISAFDHGHAGIAWAALEYESWLGACDTDRGIWSRWNNWLAAVTGHHGDFPDPRYEGLQGIEADDALIDHDRAARHALVAAFESLFLLPSGLSLQTLPPPCSLPARALLAGFCASCDWLGSNIDEFDYRAPGMELPDYLHKRLADIESSRMLERYGLLAHAKPYAGLPVLLASTESPRGVQTLIDGLPAIADLTLIEAPTGSGKTEAALAHAWRLLAAGLADSIVFALPTQATANAMFERVAS